MYRKEDLVVNYFCPKTTADSQIADIPYMESSTEENFHYDLFEWLYNFAEDYWTNDPDCSGEDEIYIQERNEDGKFNILASIKKAFLDNSNEVKLPAPGNWSKFENTSPEDEPFDSDRETDVDFNGGWY